MLKILHINLWIARLAVNTIILLCFSPNDNNYDFTAFLSYHSVVLNFTLY